MITLCDTDIEKLEHIFTHGKLSGQTNLKTLYLDPMSTEAKSSLAWIVTNIKVTKPKLTRNDLSELETKSNALSRSELNKLVESQD